MAIGYQGLVLLNQNQYHVTGGSISLTPIPIMSEGSYVASYGPHSASPYGRAVNRVHIFDFSTNTGSLTFDVNNYVLDELFRNVADSVGATKDLDALDAIFTANKSAAGGWVLNRQNPRRLTWFNNQVMKYESGKAFWTNVSVEAAEGSIVTCNLGLEIIPDYPATTPAVEEQMGSDYVKQKFGVPIPGDVSVGPVSYGGPNFMPVSAVVLNKNNRPTPWWATQVRTTPVLPTGVWVRNWSFEITNQFSKAFSCAGSKLPLRGHPGPRFVYFGVAELNFSMTLVTVQSNGGQMYTVPPTFTRVMVDFWPNESGYGRTIVLENVDNLGYTMPLVGASEAQTYDYGSAGFFQLPYLS